ncbi:glucoside xylosyltransferase 1-like [Ornithodoros turicata]|uniref:glucoside xylosyltransferase 1-like n=1 Tax=Ornithodoros turicata TaxID=34597 RepID=UPI00313A03F3
MVNMMPRKPIWLLLLITLLCGFLFYRMTYLTHIDSLSGRTGTDTQGDVSTHRSSNTATSSPNRTVTPKLAVVTCGDRLNLTLMNVKSVVAFSRGPLHMLLFADPPNMDFLLKELSKWPRKVRQRVTVEVRPVTFPKDRSKKWKGLFKPCASQRLFLPRLLPEVDALIYVDADILFLRPIEDLWDIFNQMNSSQIAGLTPETEDYTTNWYTRFARHPYVRPLGVNSGVMLMNLTRMRQFNWDSRLEPVLLKYERYISWGDQDLINIIFHDHTDKLLIFPCQWNFRPDHCWYGPTCPKETPAILHGNRNAFVEAKKEPAFRLVFDMMDKYVLETSLVEDFVNPLEAALEKMTTTYCRKELLKHVPGWKRVASSIDKDRLQDHRSITPNNSLASPFAQNRYVSSAVRHESWQWTCSYKEEQTGQTPHKVV